MQDGGLNDFVTSFFLMWMEVSILANSFEFGFVVDVYYQPDNLTHKMAKELDNPRFIL